MIMKLYNSGFMKFFIKVTRFNENTVDDEINNPLLSITLFKIRILMLSKSFDKTHIYVYIGE